MVRRAENDQVPWSTRAARPCASSGPRQPKQAPRPKRQGACADGDADPPGVGEEVQSFRGNSPQMGEREKSKDDAGAENIGSHGMKSWVWAIGVWPGPGSRARQRSANARRD